MMIGGSTCISGDIYSIVTVRITCAPDEMGRDACWDTMKLQSPGLVFVGVGFDIALICFPFSRLAARFPNGAFLNGANEFLTSLSSSTFSSLVLHLHALSADVEKFCFLFPFCSMYRNGFCRTSLYNRHVLDF